MSKFGPKTGDLRTRKHQHFWEKVNRDGPTPQHVPDLGQCWLWTAARLGKGYGSFRGYRQETVGAHRFAWQMSNGEIPRGMHVLHKCDNMLCVRVSHLFLGTNRQNVLDMLAKGRHSHGHRHGALCRTQRGESNPSAKLTSEAVSEIRSRYAEGGITQQALADQFQISRPVVNSIVNGKAWK